MEVNEGMFSEDSHTFKFVWRLQGQPIGSRVKLTELKELVENDPDLQDLSSEREEDLKNELLEYRALKTTGARPSNCSVANDFRIH
jgi:hypothetical protein